MLSPKVVSLVLVIAMLNACASPNGEDNYASNAQDVYRILDGSSGLSAIWYDSLADQVLDSDAIVVGRYVEVAYGGAVHIDDGSEEPLEHVVATLLVEDVIHSSRFVSLGRGTLLDVVLPKSPIETSNATPEKLVNDVSGIHSLFEVANDSRRNDVEYFPQFAGTWFYQDPSLIVIETENGRSLTQSYLITARLGQQPEFKEVVDEYKKEATMIARERLEQPDDVIGLRRLSDDVPGS